MLLHVIARGKIARTPEAELVSRYQKRIHWPLRLSELPESGGSAADPLNPCKTILLDERGKNLSSIELAALIEKWRDIGIREMRFIIGPADGHGDDVIEQADLLLAFGKSTWPHLLARAMLMEQIYRSTAIIAGHPYHRH